MNILTSRGLYGSGHKISTYRSYRDYRETHTHYVFDDVLRAGMLGDVRPRNQPIDNSGIICNTRVYPANAAAKEEK